MTGSKFEGAYELHKGVKFEGWKMIFFNRELKLLRNQT